MAQFSQSSAGGAKSLNLVRLLGSGQRLGRLVRAPKCFICGHRVADGDPYLRGEKIHYECSYYAPRLSAALVVHE